MLGEFCLEIILTPPAIIFAETYVVNLHGAATVKGIVRSAGIFDKGHQLAGAYRPYSGVLAEVNVAVQLDCVSGVVTVCRIVGVVA